MLMNVTVYTASWCHDCQALKKFLGSHRVAYSTIDVEADAEASAEVIRRVGKRAIPQLVIDGEWFQPYEPGRGLLEDELRRRLGITRG